MSPPIPPTFVTAVNPATVLAEWTPRAVDSMAMLSPKARNWLKGFLTENLPAPEAT